MKIWNYIFLFTTMIVIMEIVGLPTGLSSTLDTFGVTINPQTQTIEGDLSNSSNYLLIIATLIGATVASITVGILTKTFDTRLVTLPIITTVMVVFISTGWSLIKYVSNFGEFWATAIVATVFIPLGIGYALSIVDYFNGYQ